MTRDQLLGSWRPQRWEWSKAGRLLYATENLRGILIYAPDGMMAVQVASTRGQSIPPPSWWQRQGITLAVKRGLVATPGFRWGYSGRFEVDEARSRVLHHVDVRTLWVANQPVLERDFRLSGDLLYLEYDDRGDSRDRLVWRRA